MTQPVFRFAPSPNGYLHLGHALSALINYDMARAAGGRFLLRLEDIDIVRCPARFVDAAYEDLGWLDIRWETPVRRQSEHFAEYHAALDILRQRQLTYPTHLTRTQKMQRVAAIEASGIVWPLDPDGAPHYPGNERETLRAEHYFQMETKEPLAWRLDMKKAIKAIGKQLQWTEVAQGAVMANPEEWGDAVLARKEIPTSYHLSVVLDDALQGVTNVVRGHDLYASTSIHRLLQELLNLPEPRYHHHRLLLDEHGQKLAKSISSKSLRQLRSEGYSPLDIRKMVGLHAD